MADFKGFAEASTVLNSGACCRKSQVSGDDRKEGHQETYRPSYQFMENAEYQ